MIRQTLLAARNALSENEVTQHSNSACAHLQRSPVFLRAQRIALYWAVGKEARPTSLFQPIWNARKQLYLPVITQNQNLRFAPYEPSTQLINNRFNIPEPQHHPRQLLPPAELDLVVLPLSGFDANGQRMGMGGGYYDRSFAFKRLQAARKPLLMGLAFETQRVDALPSRYWDVRLNGVATEHGLTLFR